MVEQTTGKILKWPTDEDLRPVQEKTECVICSGKKSLQKIELKLKTIKTCKTTKILGITFILKMT